MKNIALYLLAVIFATACSSDSQPTTFSPDNPLGYVNPLIGTAPSTTESAQLHSEAGSELRGQTFPAVGVPFGMAQWTPQTQASEQKCLSPYYYQDDSIQGFRGSRWMSGSCTQDYGSVTIMALNGDLKVNPHERASSFSHDTETATPSYYAVELADYQIQAEVTAVSRAAMLRFTPQTDASTYLIIEPNSDEGEGYVRVIPESNEIIGYNPAHRIYQGWGESAGFSGYFVIQFEQPIAAYGVWKGDEMMADQDRAEGEGKAVGAYVQMPAAEGKPLLVRVGLSHTSLDQARKNMQAEISGWDFEQVKQTSENTWRQQLNKVQVSGNSEEDKTMFYTAMYHAMILPRLFSDDDGAFVAFGGLRDVYQAEDFDYYTDFSMWDTYRALHPLHTILNPEKTNDMIRSLVKMGEQGGWLPIFPAWNSYTSAMIGDHVTAMIGDAWMKGIDDFDKELAYSLMRKNAFQANPDRVSYLNGQGRRAMESYLEYGYIPLEDSVPDSFHQKEQVSRTLEYAFDDFVLSQVAGRLGKQEDAQTLRDRAKNYQHVFDTTTGYVRGRYADGSWIEPFDPFASRASFITEGSPYQYTWYVPHDVAGLMDLMGGKEKFIQKLDTLFEKRYYWHGNEPGHQTVYLYAYAGAPWKTQQWVRDIIREEYSAEPGGLSGNEDAGQMSAWLVFSMMGFYPVSPGMPYYVLGSPAFEETAINMTNGNTFTIKANDTSDENRYIQSAMLNGEPLERSYLLHEEIMLGGELVLEMGSEPNKAWASEQLPPSMGEMDL
ncbi:GH92 family glycosyl hydrolase [Catalinimonas niigatensis]|uniref:GH92 family glycosyl hydrolase n=1 Tax=Catalinimonas niigatensis TaxID=1397264 RepID=UPI00266564B5|nr:GH92 family glycosyl hydrolase [Catalinimonas niigatensis]WPP48481.1 GH92 family glycosyl hydrolase [Catalinimonas niigatensis]